MASSIYADGTANLGRMFMPMLVQWNKGNGVVWTEEQAVEWMRRALAAGGAWTWNVTLSIGQQRICICKLREFEASEIRSTGGDEL